MYFARGRRRRARRLLLIRRVALVFAMGLTIFAVYQVYKDSAENAAAATYCPTSSGQIVAAGSYDCTYSSAGNYTFNIPSRAINVTAEVWGGGGGGGGASSNATWYNAGGGGGGGGYIKKNFGSVMYGGTMSVTVGGYGGGGSGSNAGSPGGQSSATFNGTTISASGGAGGSAGSGTGNGGGGGSGGGNSANGDLQSNGENGGSLTGSGNARLSGYGGRGPSNTAIAGGAGGSRRPSSGQTGYFNGQNGDAPGGGGSGGRANLATNASGGNGGLGRAKISYDIPPEPAITATSINLDYGMFIGGNSVSITGTGFQTGGVPGTTISFTSVTFNGVAATNVSVSSGTNMTLTVPAYSSANPASDTAVNVVFNYQDQYGFTYSLTKTAFYTYKAAARSYTAECQDNQTGSWNVSPYTDPSQTLNCRIIVDGPFNGTISLRDLLPTTSTLLGGAFASSDSRFNAGTKAFTLTYNDTISGGRTLNFTYTPPSKATLDGIYNGSNGWQIWWPNINSTATPSNSLLTLISSHTNIPVGIRAKEFYVTQVSPNVPCVGCASSFAISTHGAPYFGTITLNGTDNISNSDNPGGSQGTFSVSSINFAGLGGADANFTYTPRVSADNFPTKYVRLAPASASPAITNGALNIRVVKSGLIIQTASSASDNLYRGGTGHFVLTVAAGWAGTVVISDPLANGAYFTGGVFTDTSSGANPSGTYNSGTRTYTFDGTAGNNVRTFDWTVPNQFIFNDYTVNITGIPNGDPDDQDWAAVNILANSLFWRCGTGYANCQYAYVGEVTDYDIRSNGHVTGDADLYETSADNPAGGSLTDSTFSFTTADLLTVSYTPDSPGRRALNADMTSSSEASMLGRTYSTLDANSLNSYIYVMADESTITGPTDLSHGQSGTYTLTLNGPFIGSINLSALLSNLSNAGGSFSALACDFILGSYNPSTNKTSCSFTYTPPNVVSTTNIGLFGDVSNSYGHSFTANGLNITVHPASTITSISPNRSQASIGGVQITITGVGFYPYFNGSNPSLEQCFHDGDEDCASVTFDVGGHNIACLNVVVVSDTQITCTTPATNALGTFSVTVDNHLETGVWTVGSGGFAFWDITLSVSSNDLVIQLDILSNEDHDSTVVTVTTDNPLGYNLSIVFDGDELICEDDFNEIIPSLTSIGSLVNNNVERSSWGFNIGSSTPGSWRPIPTVPYEIADTNSMSGAMHDGASGDNYTLWVGAKISAYTKPCTYQQSATLTALPN